MRSLGERDLQHEEAFEERDQSRSECNVGKARQQHGAPSVPTETRFGKRNNVCRDFEAFFAIFRQRARQNSHADCV
jgi:hypothetical protein